MTFTQLLVPIAPEQEINDSHHHAFQFANKCSATVTLLLVIKELAEFKEIYHLSGSSLDILDKATQHFQNSLTQHADTLSQQYPNVNFTTKVRVGKPLTEILAEAEQSQASMVIIDSYRETKTVACERGSNTLNLMRKAKLPIWSLSRVPSQIKHVAVAIDLTNSEYQDFNAQLLASSIEFCSLVGAKLSVCHVWKMESEGFLRDWSGYSDIEIALLAKSMREERIARLNTLLDEYQTSAVEIDTQVLEGETREVFPDYVVAQEIDVVFLGSMSRTGLSGLVLGNTAESMINQLDCSVITLKPN